MLMKIDSAPLHTLSKLYDVPVGSVAPYFMQCIALFVVAEERLLLDIL